MNHGMRSISARSTSAIEDSQTEKPQINLTFDAPQDFDELEVRHVDDGDYDDASECRFRDVDEERCEEGQSQKNQAARDDPSRWRFHSALRVDSCP